jgi:hypothetical protein
MPTASIEEIKTNNRRRLSQARQLYRDICFRAAMDEHVDSAEIQEVLNILKMDLSQLEADIQTLKSRRASADTLAQAAETIKQAEALDADAQAIRVTIADKVEVIRRLQAEIAEADYQARLIEDEAAGVHRDTAAKAGQAREHLRATGPDPTRARKAYDAARDQWQNRNLAINRRLQSLQTDLTGIEKIGDIQPAINVLRDAVGRWDNTKAHGSAACEKIAADRAQLQRLEALPSRFVQIHAEIARLMAESQNNQQWFNSLPVPGVSVDWRHGRLAITADEDLPTQASPPAPRSIMAENAVPLSTPADFAPNQHRGRAGLHIAIY